MHAEKSPDSENFQKCKFRSASNLWIITHWSEHTALGFPSTWSVMTDLVIEEEFCPGPKCDCINTKRVQYNYKIVSLLVIPCVTEFTVCFRGKDP